MESSRHDGEWCLPNQLGDGYHDKRDSRRKTIETVRETVENQISSDPVMSGTLHFIDTKFLNRHN